MKELELGRLSPKSSRLLRRHVVSPRGTLRSPSTSSLGSSRANSKSSFKQFVSVHDDNRRARLQKVVTAEWTWETPEPMDPYEAMHQLLKHVRLDPDGGILNIGEESGQASKLKALKKDSLELGMAATQAARTFGNPAAMIFFSCSLLYRYTFSPEYRDHMHQQCKAIKISVPLEELYVICAVVELSVAVFCVFRALYHAVFAYCYELMYAGTEYVAVSGTCYKYLYVADFWLHDVPTLQNLSILRLLSYVHPNMVAKNSKLFGSKDDIARMMLEKLVGREDNSCDEEQLAEMLARLTVQHDHAKDEEEERLQAANELIDLTPYDALMHFAGTRVAQDHAYLVSQGLRPEVLGNIWRLQLVNTGEKIAFAVVALLCAFMGSVEFFTKVCRLSLLLTDSAIPWWTSTFFFMFLLNQSLSMVSVQTLLRWRVETLIFGGTDAVVSAEERYIMRMYLASLMEKVWGTRMSFWQKVAIMLQLDDDDLQQLVIEEQDRHKGVIAASIRKWIRRQPEASGFSVRDKVALWAVQGVSNAVKSTGEVLQIY